VNFKRLVPLIAAAVTFGLALAVFTAMSGGGSSDGPRTQAAPDLLKPGATATQQAAALRVAAQARPHDPRVFAALGSAELQLARETADPAHYARAGNALRRALTIDPRQPDALTGMGTLSLARHDFSGGLRFARAARRANPDSLAPYPVQVDALVELGRYGQAVSALQALIDAKPTLASYARVSYLRELNGDLAGAVAAMRLAISAGGDAPENVAYVQTLLGDLELQRGRVASAERAYRTALARRPGHPGAIAGLAKVEVARGRPGRAIARLRPLVARLPLPEYALALAEDELASGRGGAGRHDLGLVAAEQRLLAAAGVNVDVESALFEADHGSPRRGVALARAAWRRAPSVRSADALGWSLTRSGHADAGARWARHALRLGSRDRLFNFHAGMTLIAAGRRREGETRLRGALARGAAGLSPLHAATARRALGGRS
jgi:cytochrome c-type biogenesis protein CcmH/NrfG